MAAGCGPLAVAYSGGRDSTALLHATWRAAQARRQQTGQPCPVVALHIHHGLSAHADAWLAHCEAQCADWRAAGADLAFHAERLVQRPLAGDSVEAWARQQRYAALARLAQAAGCHSVLLAHHREDQAETFLLQALRGGGAAGLAAMPVRTVRDGVNWLRPWLRHPRAAIEAYVAQHGLRYIDDDSNTDPRYARNRLRLQVWPVLVEAFPQAATVLGEAARHAQDAADCLDALAAIDLAAVASDAGLDVRAAEALGAPRWRNLLRRWLPAQGVAARAGLIDRLVAELPGCDAGTWPTSHGARRLRLHRGRLHVTESASGDSGEGGALLAGTEEALPDLRGRTQWPMPAWGGVLTLQPTGECSGLASERLRHLIARPRGGGEQFQRAPGTPPRSLKKQYQLAGVPAWQRHGPLLWEGDTLVFVPGLGVDARVWGAPDAPRVALDWQGGSGNR
jgi:tRNA(Ile)-lysidine synthase